MKRFAVVKKQVQHSKWWSCIKGIFVSHSSKFLSCIWPILFQFFLFFTPLSSCHSFILFSDWNHFLLISVLYGTYKVNLFSFEFVLPWCAFIFIIGSREIVQTPYSKDKIGKAAIADLSQIFWLQFLRKLQKTIKQLKKNIECLIYFLYVSFMKGSQVVT